MVSGTSKTLGIMEVAKLDEQKSKDLFKTPLNHLIKRRKKILDEDLYIKNVGDIIERDFFPDLRKFKNEAEGLETSGKFRVDTSELGPSVPPLGGSSPATFETPAAERREDEERSAADIKDIPGDKTDGQQEEEKGKLSLDEFLANHTSEDNENFEVIIKEASERARRKNTWLQIAEIEYAQDRGDVLRVPSIEEQANPGPRPLNLDTWGLHNQNYIMYVPDGVPPTREEMIEQATKRRTIVHDNTRLQANPFNERHNKEIIQHLAQTQAYHTVDGKIGVDGREMVRTETPKVNGFSFVGTPSPAPGVNESPLMTWGGVDSTPFQLGGNDTPMLSSKGRSFRIAEPPKRERLAMELAGKASEGLRSRKQKALEVARRKLGTPTPGSTSGVSLDRLNSMSPAARRLSSQLRLPRSRLSTPGKPTITTPGRSTRPVLDLKLSSANTESKRKVGTPANHITDDLLQLPSLPKRPRASDFF
ncbi:splicing factor ESS-2 homolog [Bacillus rossius redtenbacheri]|uniref:splicing factor ESS-2 homolog n=1 Tax=Bacillus rossius redtenbacheri TaxID=93214 RepID=UPI002FDDC3A3